MFISPAYAQTAGASPASPDMLMQLLPLVLIFVVFYFLLIRPQQRKMKQHREMLSALRRGDKVVTGGGIIGSVTKVVDENEVQVEIAEGVRVRVQRPSIAAVLAKPEPAGDNKPSAGGGGSTGGTPANDAGDAGQPSKLGKLFGIGKK